MTTPLQIQLLGSPTVSFQERPLKFRSRKVLALLVYLVITGERHARDSLMALFWPESDPKRASASLRSAISRLRQTLAEVDAYIVTQSGMVAFDFNRPYTLDVQLLESAAQEGATPKAMKIALDAVRGEFLEGFSLTDAPRFDDWVSIQRERWQHCMERVYERLTRHLLATGESREALVIANQWLAYAPFSETAYLTLMEAHFLSGDRTAALQVYDRCVQMLQEELNLEPAAETVALAERIRSKKDKKIRDEVDLSSPGDRPVAIQELPLVGRADEHAQLAALFQQAVQGEVQVSALIGEAGIGKSRLAQAFLTWASFTTPPADVLQGRAFEMGGRLPYQPIVDALRIRLDAENAPEDLLPDVWLAELSQLLPELRDRYPDLPRPLTGDPNFVRARIFEAVTNLMIALAERRPVVLFVDDLQWTDAGTLDLLHYLARRCTEEKAKVLTLLTARQENLAELRDWFSRLGRESSLSRLNLSALPVTAVQKLVSVLAGEETGQKTAIQSFGGWLQKETGGVPFFMEAMLQMLVEQRILPRQERRGRTFLDVSAVWQQIQNKERLPIPPGVHEVILSRFGQLSEQAKNLLLAGAVIGRESSFERLCQVADIKEEKGLTALSELTNGRLLLEMSREARPYRFAHDNIRQVIYSEAGEAHRRLVHRRALTVLEQAGAPAAELAYHALAIRQDAVAFRYLLAAGDAALAASVPAEAITHYNRAREIAANTSIESELLRQLYNCRGRGLELDSQFDKALANYKEMAARGEKQYDEALILASLTARCILHATQTPLFDPAQARTLGEQALLLAQRLDDRPTEAKVLWGLLLVEIWSGGDPRKALMCGEKSLAICRELDLKEQMGFTLTNMVNVYWALERKPDARKANLEARAVWLELGIKPMLADSYSMSIWSHWLAGEFDLAVAAANEGIRISRAIGNKWNESTGLEQRAQVYLDLGRLGAALSSLQEAIAPTEASGLNRSYGTMVSTGIYLVAGDLTTAEKYADELIEHCREAVFLFHHLGLGVYAQAKTAVGKLSEAERILNQVKNELNVEEQSFEVVAFLLLAEVAWWLASGEPEKALARIQSIVPWAKRVDVRCHLAEALLLQGRAHLALKEWELAREALLEAEGIAAEMKQRRVWWQILAALFELESAAGHTDVAERYREQSLEIIHFIADQIDDPELRRVFLGRTAINVLTKM